MKTFPQVPSPISLITLYLREIGGHIKIDGHHLTWKAKKEYLLFTFPWLLSSPKRFAENHWKQKEPRSIDPSAPPKLIAVTSAVGPALHGCIRRRKFHSRVSQHEWLSIIMCTTIMLNAAAGSFSGTSSSLLLVGWDHLWPEKRADRFQTKAFLA
jgi:hypothetical protein